MFLDIFDSAVNQQYFKDESNLIWLHGTLLCKKLGYKNPSQAIQLHTDEDERQQIIVNGRNTWFVSEYGVWGLILSAKTDEAIAFKRKLKHEILPKLRADGGYIMPTATSEQLEALQGQIEEMKLEIANKDNIIFNAQRKLNYIENLDGMTKTEYGQPFVSLVAYKNARNNTRHQVAWSRLLTQKQKDQITKECDRTFPHPFIAFENKSNIEKYVIGNGVPFDFAFAN